MEGEVCVTDRFRACREAEERSDLLGLLFQEQIERLRIAVKLRMGSLLARRVGVEDVLQETYVEASRRLDDYLSEPRLPFHLWLRFLALQKLKTLRRRHVIAKMRDARREVPLLSDSSSNGGAPQAWPPVGIPQEIDSPSKILMRDEKKSRFERALDSLPLVDREIVILRHFEQLPWSDIARILRIQEPTARQRHARALLKLKDALRASVREKSAFWR